MKTSPQQNLITGQTLLLEPPDNLPYAGVAIYNGNNLLVSVSIAGNTDVIQPYQAKFYDMPTSGSLAQIIPISSNPEDYYVGTIYGVFYLANELPVYGFPLPLTAFPGGEQLQAVLPTTPDSWTISPPAGTGQITIQETTPSSTFTVKGVQTGTDYGSPLVTGNLLTWYFISAAGSAQGVDTDFLVARTSTGGGGELLYVSPSVPIPTQPNLFVTGLVAGDTVTLLPALSVGAYYLFGWDIFTTTSATGGSVLGLSANSVEFALGVWTGAAPGVDLQGVRVEGPITCTSASTAIVTLRYAIGP